METAEGTLIIGINEENPQVNTSSPIIIGNLLGIHNRVNATFNFYDGVIMGQTGRSILGDITDVPEGYAIVNGTETIDGVEYETSYLSKSAPIINHKYKGAMERKILQSGGHLHENIAHIQKIIVLE